MTPALIWSFARQELVDRYAGSALGFAWAFVQPVFMMFIYIVIFGELMGSRLPGVALRDGYSIYLVAGMLPWLAFANTLARTATVFVDKKPVLSKVGLSLTMLPLFVVLAETATFVIGLALFGVYLLLAGHAPSPHLLTLPWIFLVQQMLALGIGLILAVLNVFLRDVREFSGIFVQLWFWFTPIVWTPQIMSPELFARLKMLNPMASVVTAYQAIFLGNARPDYSTLALVAVLAAATLAVGYLFVRRMEKDVRDVI